MKLLKCAQIVKLVDSWASERKDIKLLIIRRSIGDQLSTYKLIVQMCIFSYFYFLFGLELILIPIQTENGMINMCPNFLLALLVDKQPL